MPRYIDADEIQYTMLYKENWITNTGVEKQGVWKDDIDKMQTADVVEVVRCHDCKFAEVADANDSEDGYICQFHRGSIWFSGSYCSWGERKEA